MGYEAVVIGASLGGMHALKKVLMQLPQDFPVPILIVQHLSPKSDSFLIGYLDGLCEMVIKEADEKEKIMPGHAYIAPPNYHLLVETDGDLALSVDEKVNYARPSIDILFESAADFYGDKLIGIVLTGANYDGAKGLKQIKEKGGLTIVQDPLTAECDIMPRAALKMTKVDYISTLDDIGRLLRCLMMGGERID